MRKTALHKKLPFNMESTFVRLYFGKDKKRLVTYPEFSQFLHDFHEEYGLEAFKRCDKDGTGFISAGDFRDIMLSVKKHLLTKELMTKVLNVSYLLLLFEWCVPKNIICSGNQKCRTKKTNYIVPWV